MRVTVPTADLHELLADDLPEGVTLDLWPMTDPPEGRVDLAVMPYLVGAELLRVLDGADVGWVQSQSLGYDNVENFLPAGIGFSNAVGVHEAATAEIALGLILAAQRNLADHVLDQQRAVWRPRFGPGLQSLTALVIGVGGVGGLIAEHLSRFGMDVIRSASRARTDTLGTVHGPDEVADLVGRADVVVLATPLTPETKGFFGSGLIARMKPGALLVNIGRGALVDTDALVAACMGEHVRAALDVVDPEPLPPDHPLWSAPGVLITPHVGGRSTTMINRVAALVARQIRHLAAGEPLESPVAAVMRPAEG